MHGSTSGIHQEIQSAALRPRAHLKVFPASSGVRQLSVTSLQFEKAFCYGVQAVSASAAPTANATTVWLGEKDPLTGTVVFLDEIPNVPGEPMEIPNPTGAKLDFINFYLLTANGTDGVVVKYH